MRARIIARIEHTNTALARSIRFSERERS